MRRLLVAAGLALALLAVGLFGRPGAQPGAATPAGTSPGLGGAGRQPSTAGSPAAPLVSWLARPGHRRGGSVTPHSGRRPPAATSTASSEPGTMVIPRIGVLAPVYDRGVDAAGQMIIADGYAITHLSLTAQAGERGNYVAYGHDDIQGQVFRSLSLLRPGDRIDLYQGGRRYRYLISGSHIVPPSDVAILGTTPGPTLTLISCTPYMVDTLRIAVTARLQEVTPIS